MFKTALAMGLVCLSLMSGCYKRGVAGPEPVLNDSPCCFWFAKETHIPLTLLEASAKLFLLSQSPQRLFQDFLNALVTSNVIGAF